METYGLPSPVVMFHHESCGSSGITALILPFGASRVVCFIERGLSSEDWKDLLKGFPVIPSSAYARIWYARLEYTGVFAVDVIGKWFLDVIPLKNSVEWY